MLFGSNCAFMPTTVAPGTTRPALYFAHANGFPGATYHRLLSLLAGRFDVSWLPMAGHDPRHPVTDGWPHLAEELIEDLAAKCKAPAVGVGHSLGGYLILLAAARRPALFRTVILLDAPLFGGLASGALRLIKGTWLMDRVTPAGRTRSRRRHFSSASEAQLYFRHKPLFRHFAAQCLSDYVEHGMRTGSQGLTLRFDPEVEARIYRTIPHHFGSIARELQCPAALVAGLDSSVIRQAGLAASRRQLRVLQTEGTHLFPFEHPDATARTIERLCRDFGILPVDARHG
jgi:pimeloyl-ACP methyl ester carboxylesterase